MTDSGEFISFQRRYLTVFLLAMFSDWLQGPYVYALYEQYDYSHKEISILFVAGFGSSCLFGTFVGSLADAVGRKRICLLYCLLYALGCFTKFYNNFHVLFFGRLLCGVATSILFSGFESWMVHEHVARNFGSNLLDETFAKAYGLNSFAAILAGLVATQLFNHFGILSAFAFAAFCLGVCALVVLATWTENYGLRQANLRLLLSKAVVQLKTDSKCVCLGFIQSFFEAAMYIFVLLWTPIVDYASGDHPPSLGLIFSCFMISIFAGTQIFRYLAQNYEPEKYLIVAIQISCVCFLLPILFAENRPIILLSFVVYEIMVGIFWPSMGALRSKYVPEEIRSTMLNIFRVPLNLIVALVLLFVSKEWQLLLALSILCLSLVAQIILSKIYKPNEG